LSTRRESIRSSHIVHLAYLELARWDDFRQIDWVSEIEFPKLTLKQTQELLTIPV